MRVTRAEEAQAALAAYERAFAEEGYVAAAPHAERVLAIVDRWWTRGHGGSQIAAARMRYTIARAALDRGDAAAMRDHLAKGLEAAERARLLKEPGFSYEARLLMLSRAEMRVRDGDVDGSLADIDAALALEPAPGMGDAEAWSETELHLRLARVSAFEAAGRYDQAEREANAALDLASRRHPAFVPLALERLSMIHRATGAPEAGDHPLAAASAITQAQDARPTERMDLARAVASRAIESGDLALAEEQLREMQRIARERGDERMAAGTGAGFAEIARRRGDLAGAADLARRAAAEAERVGERTGAREAYEILGQALAGLGRTTEALGALDRARALAGSDAMELMRVDAVRLATLFQAAGSDPAGYAACVDAAVPLALASDAVRYGLAPGEMRDRWAANVAAWSADAALRALTALGRADEILDLIEHICASASVDPLAEPGSELLDPPPRVRSMPGAEPAIAWALAAAEERYGRAARGDEVVDAW
ncbi:hypothetical protein [Microbacterium indicum]|uniref:hypothetical protein n=1 Tax=Microbacterium indicum TaxID=358100 RepID=UPI0012EC2BF4|nr:hypothetical protein [Microbacterium indicum]